MTGAPGFHDRLEAIDDLLKQIDSEADPSIPKLGMRVVHLLMELHGVGLARMLEIVETATDAESIRDRLMRDEIVANLLVLHDLHPLDLEARVQIGLDRIASRLRSHGGEIVSLDIEDATVRVHVKSNGNGCHSSPDALKELIESAIYGIAPDISALSIDGLDIQAGSQKGFVPLASLRNNPIPA